MAKGKKTVYFCQNCGHEESKWLGQCPMCKEWNTFVEEKVSCRQGEKTSGEWMVQMEESTGLPRNDICPAGWGFGRKCRE